MLTEKQKKRVRERVYRRFSRLAKKLRKDYREIEINGKTYREALEFELAKEIELAKKGEESRLKQKIAGPDRILREIEQQPTKKKGKSRLEWLTEKSSDIKSPHAETCTCPRCMGGFGDPDLVDAIPESDEDYERRKAFEKSVNEEFEKECACCPICKSRPCRCSENGE